MLPFTDGVAYERVAALRPDLVLATYSGLSQADYDRLSQIAPTVAQPGDVPDYGVGWREQTTTVGAALGRPAAAADLVAGVEKRFADARAAHPEFAGRTGEVATFYDSQYYVYGSKDPRGRVLGERGRAAVGARSAVVHGPGGAHRGARRLLLLRRRHDARPDRRLRHRAEPARAARRLPEQLAALSDGDPATAPPAPAPLAAG